MAKGRGLRGPALREFRHKVSQLKAKGLTSKRVDARKQRPTRYFMDKVKRLTPVLEGKAVGVKVSPEFLRQYREAGYAIENRRVMVAKRPDEIHKARAGLPTFEKVVAPAPASGGPRIVQRRVVLPASARNIHGLLDDMEARPERWNRLKKPTDQFAFTFMGGRSRATFYDVESLREYLETYLEKIEQDQSEELWESLEFFTLGPEEGWYNTPEYEAIKKARRRGRQNDRGGYERYRYAKWKSHDMALADERERKRAYRAKLTGDKLAKVQTYDRNRKAASRQDVTRVAKEYETNNTRRREQRRIMRSLIAAASHD